jgi:hypothetical protein
MSLNDERFFAAIPFEVRAKIWELTIVPRILNFNYDFDRILESSPRYKPEEGRRNFSVDDNDTLDIPALSVCRESRKLAMTKGYRPWKVQNISWEFRQMMWNPAFDTISFGEYWTGVYLILMFGSDFPVEKRLVKYLALTSSSWAYPHNNSFPDTGNLIEFDSLREICVIVDVPYEYQRCIDSGLSDDPWAIPQAIAQNLSTVAEDFEKSDWKTPYIRAVQSEEGILGGETLQLVLRQYPCPGIDTLLSTK